MNEKNYENIIYDYELKTFNQNISNDSFSSYVLGIDVGGTNATLGIAGIQEKTPILLCSLQFASTSMDSLIPAILQSLEYAKKEYGCDIFHSCIGAAGVISEKKDFAELTNLNWNISTNEILKHTPLQSAVLVNDFQAIGYGIRFLDHENKNHILQIRSKTNKPLCPPQNKAIIGAGTGLGKCLLYYDSHLQHYVPLASEGGHSDLPIYSDSEKRLVRFIQKEKNDTSPLCYEDVLSGRGINFIYDFLYHDKQYNESSYMTEIESSTDKTSLISRYRNKDELCKETFRYFSKFYGRCAKNFVLDTMAIDGLYIAGGIAMKNYEIFQSNDFLSEFEHSKQRKNILSNTPLYVIMNYDVSLYGTCFIALQNIL